MVWDPTVFSLLAFVAAAIFAVLVAVGWRRQEGSQTFASLMAVVTFWAAIYGVQLGFTTEQGQLVWQRAVLATSGGVPPLFLLFAYEYAGKRERLDGRVKGVLAGESVVFAGLAFTNSIHHLVWSRATLQLRTVSPALDLTFGVGYVVHILFAYLLVAVALWTILSVYFRSAWVHRRQSTLLLVGAVPAFAAHVLFTLKASPVSGLDLTPFVFAFTGVVYGLALFHFDLLERTPVAHRRAVELTGDGLLVVDTDGLIVDTNHVARQIYGIDRGTKTHVSTVAGEPDPEHLHETKTDGVVDGTRRVYERFVSELSVESGRHAGYAIVLRDVTDRHAYEQRLEVANRVLRHNLRNDMNVISGYADLLAERATSSEQEELVETISATAEGLVELSEKARQMVDIEKSTRPDGEKVDVVSTLEPLVEEFRETCPAMTLRVDCPDEANAAIVSTRTLTIPLRNLLENAVEHNDADIPTVEVTLTETTHSTVVDTETGEYVSQTDYRPESGVERVDADAATVSVADNGPGIPEAERVAVLETGVSQLDDPGSGFGLYLVKEMVRSYGGEVDIADSDLGGTAIDITLLTERPDPERDDQNGASAAGER